MKIQVLLSIFFTCLFLINSSGQTISQSSNNYTNSIRENLFKSIKLNFENLPLIKKGKNFSPNKLNTKKIQTKGDTVSWTYYDYGCNSVMQRRLALSENGIHFVYDYGGYDYGGYEYNFYSKNLGFLGGQELPGTVREVANGLNSEAYFASKIFIPNFEDEYWFSKDSCEGCYNFTDTYIGSKSISSIARSQNNIYIGGTETIYVSTDDGETFTEAPSFPVLLVGQFISSWEIPLSTLSNDPSTIAFAFIEEEDNTSIFSGALSWGKSTDAGTTWSTNIIIDEEDITAEGHHYLVENFGQFTNVLSSDGKFHVAFNGYGVQMSDVNPDSVAQFIYPLMYWNNVDQQFIELTLPDITRDNSLSWGKRPGNGLGNAYPSISVSNDGVLAVIWQQPEIANDEFVMLTNSDSESAYATDIYCSVSPNNGLSWSAPFKVAGTESESDVFPVIAKSIEITNDGKYIIHFMYMWDTEIGVSLFDGGGSETECAWIYGSYDITDQLITVGIDNKSNPLPIKHYSLLQNYPNPFNPSTKIKFSVSQPEFISLKVYDLLGNQITTLIAEQKQPGSYEVKFNADNLTSGIYFYELVAGGFRQTNKMLLLK